MVGFARQGNPSKAPDALTLHMLTMMARHFHGDRTGAQCAICLASLLDLAYGSRIEPLAPLFDLAYGSRNDSIELDMFGSARLCFALQHTPWHALCTT